MKSIREVDEEHNITQLNKWVLRDTKKKDWYRNNYI